MKTGHSPLCDRRALGVHATDQCRVARSVARRNRLHLDWPMDSTPHFVGNLGVRRRGRIGGSLDRGRYRRRPQVWTNGRKSRSQRPRRASERASRLFSMGARNLHSSPPWLGTALSLERPSCWRLGVFSGWIEDTVSALVPNSPRAGTETSRLHNEPTEPMTLNDPGARSLNPHARSSATLPLQTDLESGHHRRVP